MMEEGHKSPNRRNDKACATWCGVFFAVILGLVTIAIVDFVNTPTQQPVPTTLMDNRCYFKYWNMNTGHKKFKKPASDNLFEYIVDKVLSHQKDLRKQFYVVDPITVYGILYVVFPIVYIVVRLCCCYINGDEENIVSLMFIIYIGMHFCYQVANYTPLNKEKCEAAFRASFTA